MYFKLYILLAVLNTCSITCHKQIGPDPWNYDSGSQLHKLKDDHNVPPDLRLTAKKKIEQSNDIGIAEWFFRTTLSVILNGGQVKQNEDGTVHISLQLKLDANKRAIIDNYLKSASPFTEEMYRHSIGYVQHGIYKPSLAERIVLTWGEYIQFHLTEYKEYIMWTLAAAACVLGFIWLQKFVSRRHLIILAISLSYLYEAFTSYKEAEHQEVKRFLDAVDSCKWRFWSSSCDVPHPDPLIFLKHMNPLKIGLRMFTILISEPMLAISGTVKAIIHGITDELWFPLDKIVYGFLLLTFNILIIMLLVMIVFNYIFNIPFNLGFLGIFSINVKQRYRNLLGEETVNRSRTRSSSNNKISDTTLNKLLDVCNKALDNTQQRVQPTPLIFDVATITNNTKTIKRSLSAGRLSDLVHRNVIDFKNCNLRKRSHNRDGSGDAL